MRMSDEQAAQILTVGTGRRLRAGPPAAGRPMWSDECCSTSCWTSCPRSSRARCSRTPPGASGAATPTRAWRSSATACSALAVTTHLYPRLEAERFGAGRLTKIRAQAVSGVSCRAVAERLALPERLRAAAPAGVRENAAALVETERVLASVIEAVIGACYLHAGYERTAEAVVEAFSAGDRAGARAPRGLQVRAAGAAGPARCGRSATRSPSEDGPPHERTYMVVARVDGRGPGQRQRQEQEARRAGGRARGGGGARG